LTFRINIVVWCNGRTVINTFNMEAAFPPLVETRGSHAEFFMEGSEFLDAAQTAESEQTAILDGASVEQTYQAALATYIEAKYEQVEHMEERLENLIGQQESRLQQIRSNAPGILSRPGAKLAWQNQQAQQQARLQTLHARLDAIHEIREGMGLRSPKIEELATRRMRAENPELASSWDAMREAMRRHDLIMRQQKAEAQARKFGRSQVMQLGAGD